MTCSSKADEVTDSEMLENQLETDLVATNSIPNMQTSLAYGT